MPVHNGLSSIIVSKFKAYCKNSTLHGVYYFYKSSKWSVHLLWTIIISSSVALCCFLSHMIWEKFVIDPTLTVVETTHHSMVNVPFPAATVCDTENVYLPRTQNMTDLFLLRGFNQTQIQDYYRSLTDVKNKGYTPAPYVKKMHSLLEDIGYPTKVLLNMFKRPCSDMIVECVWRSRKHNCTEMFRPVFTIAGHCCQFDITYFKEHADEQTNMITGLDSTEALEIIVSQQTRNIDRDESNSYAVLYVYDHMDKVTLVDSAINLTPETYFDVNVFVWVIDSSPYVRALALSSRKCILETDTGAGAVFYQECMSRLILKRVANQCKCLPFDYTSKQLDVDEYSVCSWERLFCVYQTIELVQGAIKDVISTSECFQRCDYVQYDTEVEFIRNRRHLSMLNSSRSKVQIHFGQNTCMKYRREVLYTWDQMLANLGGIFGLCLGGSVISVIELVWFIFELIYAIITNTCKKPIAPKENERNKVFIISQKDMKSKKSETTIVGKYKFVN